MIVTLFKAFRKLKQLLQNPLFTPIAQIQFYLNGIKWNKSLNVNGVMKVHISRRGKVKIGKNLSVNSGQNFNIIGRQQKKSYGPKESLLLAIM
jgi:hypothetical protein